MLLNHQILWCRIDFWHQSAEWQKPSMIKWSSMPIAFVAGQRLYTTCFLNKPRSWTETKPNHTIYTLFIHYLYTIYTLFIHYLYTIYTLFIDYLYTIYTLFIHYLHTIYTLFIHYLYTIYTLFIHYLYTFYTLFIHYLYTIYTLSIHYLYTIYTIFIHYLYTIYTLFIHYLYTIYYTIYTYLSQYLQSFLQYVSQRYLSLPALRKTSCRSCFASLCSPMSRPPAYINIFPCNHFHAAPWAAYIYICKYMYTHINLDSLHVYIYYGCICLFTCIQSVWYIQWAAALWCFFCVCAVKPWVSGCFFWNAVPWAACLQSVWQFALDSRSLNQLFIHVCAFVFFSDWFGGVFLFSKDLPFSVFKKMRLTMISFLFLKFVFLFLISKSFSYKTSKRLSILISYL